MAEVHQRPLIGEALEEAEHLEQVGKGLAVAVLDGILGRRPAQAAQGAE